ncbi:hypothetical protein [Sphingomonas jaspsi]|uniref:hypothetical protein n=1 Tax=Sphingomonas jaspsi TaxID=392409 RepID=UPI0004B19F5E|nr:hypothetical protein [Sphingomonas jaspsi]
MDIIAAHRDGLTQKLDLECADLAGRARDFGQRAIVLHHLYDHSLGGHWWALLEAVRQMEIDRALQALEGKARAWWRGRKSQETALEALAALRTALGDEQARRTAIAYRTYRMAGTPALADALCDGEHARRLVDLHARRRDGEAIDPASAVSLVEAVEADIGSDPDGAVATAWAAVDATFVGKAARAALQRPTPEQLVARHAKKGWAKLERTLREDPFLPAAFRANPAQHFYALQHGLADRRRKEWVEGVGKSEALAA